MNKGSPLKEQDLLIVGRVIKPHGFKGRLKILSFVETPQFYKEIKTLYLGKDLDSIREYRVRSFQAYRNKAIVEFHGMDYQEAKCCTGENLWVKRSQLPPLEEAEFYWADILGCSVETEAGQFLGTIESILRTASNDVYVCKKDNHETLIPALDQVIRKVDPIKKVMMIRILEHMT